MSKNNPTYHDCLTRITEILGMSQDEVKEALADHETLAELIKLYYQIHRHYGTFLKFYNEMPEGETRDRSVVYEMVLHHYHKNITVLNALTSCARYLKQLPNMDRTMWSFECVTYADCFDYLPRPNRPVKPKKLVRTVVINNAPYADCVPATNLYLEIFGRLPENEMDEACLPELIAIIDESLTEREAFAVKMRFGFDGDGLDGEAHTLEQCGIEMGVSQERFRQILAKAIRRLRHSSRNNIVRQLFMTRVDLLAELNVSKRDNLELSIQNAVCKEEVSRLEGILHLANEETIPRAEVDFLQMSIWDLGFSTRTCHGIIRSGIKNVRDLLDTLNEKKLLHIRGIGKRSLQEVEEKMRSMGFTFPDN